MPPRDLIVPFDMSEMKEVLEEARARRQDLVRQAFAAARARAAYARYRQLSWFDRFLIRAHVALNPDCNCDAHKIFG